MLMGLRPGKNNAWAWYLVAMAALTFAYLFVAPLKGYAVVINVIGISSPLAIGIGMRITGLVLPLRILKSSGLRLAAMTSIRTSRGPTEGAGRSSTERTSGPP